MLGQTAASRAAGDQAASLELVEHVTGVEAGAALQAADGPRRAMQFQNIAAAGDLMQAVDILGHDPAGETTLFPAREGTMSHIRLRADELDMRFSPLAPILKPRLGIGEILIEQDRLSPRPDTSWRAKIGNAALGTDAGPGKQDCRAGTGEPIGDFVNVGVHL